LLKDRVYYVRETLVKAAASIQRENLLHLGVCYAICFRTAAGNVRSTRESVLIRLFDTASDCLTFRAANRVRLAPTPMLSTYPFRASSRQLFADPM
jgi:ribosome biogenesis protein Nip4